MGLFPLGQAQTRESIYFFFLVDQVPCRESTASTTEKSLEQVIRTGKVRDAGFPRDHCQIFQGSQIVAECFHLKCFCYKILGNL